ncbi:hypothetical protein PAXINDRAFT_18047 [Paxillus involutus ATCC 200175]|uniref:Uncharacterized protein n=1 Tax=Paxillus involutus ATCC 200175 TaxID=664439 RepID=A0A0C9SPB5_PAXIN|nr:hypothetical protein PAXINDRAFT_18047 [Paxillus involutus ATCC 200175]
MAYLYVTQSRVDTDLPHTDDEANDFLREIWNGGEGGEKRIFISVGGHTRDTVLSTAELGGLVAFGRLYVPNVNHKEALNEATLAQSGIKLVRTYQGKL